MTVVVLPGDGIGPEVMREALRALETVAPDLELEEHAFGAQAIRDTGDSLPGETLAACKASEATWCLTSRLPSSSKVIPNLFCKLMKDPILC